MIKIFKINLRQRKISLSLTKKNMILLEKTEQYEIYLDFFEKIPIRILKDIKTNEISFMAEDVAKALDYGSLENMMGSNEVLDMMNEVHSQTGSYPIYAIDIN